jgi:hypothetical protein
VRLCKQLEQWEQHSQHRATSESGAALPVGCVHMGYQFGNQLRNMYSHIMFIRFRNKREVATCRPACCCICPCAGFTIIDTLAWGALVSLNAAARSCSSCPMFIVLQQQAAAAVELPRHLQHRGVPSLAAFERCRTPNIMHACAIAAATAPRACWCRLLSVMQCVIQTSLQDSRPHYLARMITSNSKPSGHLCCAVRCCRATPSASPSWHPSAAVSSPV